MARKRQKRKASLREVKSVVSNEEAKLEISTSRPKFGKLHPRTENQAKMINLMNEKRLVFAVGPAGTGRTFCSTSWAVEKLMDDEIERIIITRPMAGCDEDMGFLPGDENEKFSVWLDPYMDVLEGKLGKSRVQTLMKFEKIIAKPLMMMRGSTFRNAVVILDEAQNTTPGQMKMFLTRVGEGTRLIINGDLEQTDLPAHKGNGLKEAMSIFKPSARIGVVRFEDSDITRDPLVREIIKTYRLADNRTYNTEAA